MSRLVSALVAVPSDVTPLYVAIVLLETVLAVALFSLLAYAFYHRRSIPYLLLACAAGTILARGLIGTLPMVTVFDPSVHILIDHGLDIVLVSMAFGAVYYARRVTPTTS